jgi:hypothetical protein
MELKIFTIPFDEEMEEFDTKDIENFCFNKKVISQQTHFFIKEGQPYWTVLVWYETVVEKMPRSTRYTINNRIANLAVDVIEMITEAIYTKQKKINYNKLT